LKFAALALLALNAQILRGHVTLATPLSPSFSIRGLAAARQRRLNGLTENAGRENDGPSKLHGMKLQDMKLQDMKLHDMKMPDMKMQDMKMTDQK